MLGFARNEARRVGALVAALEQDEITLGEFSEGLNFLTPEAAQVIACMLGEWIDWACEDDGSRVSNARLMSRQFAAQTRILS